jgi:hypothetical protein
MYKDGVVGSYIMYWGIEISLFEMFMQETWMEKQLGRTRCRLKDKIKLTP